MTESKPIRSDEIMTQQQATDLYQNKQFLYPSDTELRALMNAVNLCIITNSENQAKLSDGTYSDASQFKKIMDTRIIFRSPLLAKKAYDYVTKHFMAGSNTFDTGGQITIDQDNAAAIIVSQQAYVYTPRVPEKEVFGITPIFAPTNPVVDPPYVPRFPTNTNPPTNTEVKPSKIYPIGTAIESLSSVVSFERSNSIQKGEAVSLLIEAADYDRMITIISPPDKGVQITVKDNQGNSLYNSGRNQVNYYCFLVPAGKDYTLLYVSTEGEIYPNSTYYLFGRVYNQDHLYSASFADMVDTDFLVYFEKSGIAVFSMTPDSSNIFMSGLPLASPRTKSANNYMFNTSLSFYVSSSDIDIPEQYAFFVAGYYHFRVRNIHYGNSTGTLMMRSRPDYPISPDYPFTQVNYSAGDTQIDIETGGMAGDGKRLLITYSLNEDQKNSNKSKYGAKVDDSTIFIDKSTVSQTDTGGFIGYLSLPISSENAKYSILISDSESGQLDFKVDFITVNM